MSNNLFIFQAGLEKVAYYYGLKKIDRNQFPDFLGLGAQKAGSTWLYENLKCHPELFLPAERELHYFDQHFNRPLREYYQHFKNHSTLVKGEVMPGYGIIPKWKIDWIRRVQPDMKLILIVRDPIDRAWSHARMSYGTLHHRDLSTVSAKEFIHHFKHPLSVKKGNYLKILANWHRYFSADSICILFYDDLFEQGEKLLNQVFVFLAVSPIQNFADFKLQLKINTGPAYEMPTECRLFLKKFYRQDIFSLRDKLGPKVDVWIKKYYG